MEVRGFILQASYRVISGVPVVAEDGHLTGIVTGRDLRFETRLDDPVSALMIPRERLMETAGLSQAADPKPSWRVPW